MSRGFCIEVDGKYACFTRPELKVERVSYDVPTPSAIKGIFESILWKPAISWRIRKIEVLAPIRWFRMTRNELKTKTHENPTSHYIEDVHTQRTTAYLRDVKYRFYADFVFIPPEKRENEQQNRTDETYAKYAAMFQRRAENGQFFTAPYFGCRECGNLNVRLITDPQQNPAVIPEELKGERNFGWMLYEVIYPKEVNNTKTKVNYSYFNAVMNDGVILIPDRHDTEKVKKGIFNLNIETGVNK